MGKWKLYTPVLVIFLCFLAVVVFDFCISGEAGAARTPAALQFRDQAHGLTLAPYYDAEEDTYFLFLPGCTDPADITLTSLTESGALTFSKDGIRLSLTELPLRQDVDLSLYGGRYTFQLWKCDALPTVSIETKADALELLHSDKNSRIDSQVTILDEKGQILLRDVATISGRGNGTWRDQAKRPYNLGFSKNVSFGPFEDLKDLCLFAEYSDESKLRNSLCYYAGQELGIPYASPYLYTNVYVNGEYLGLYAITTKKEYTKHIETDGIKAVFELTSTEGPNSFRSGFFGQPLDVMYGDMAHVENVVNQFESALYFQRWEELGERMDLDSMALKYAMEEFFANIDMTYASQYFYIDSSGVIHCMLPWDFDFTLYSAITHFNNKQEYAILGYRDPFSYSWYPPLLEWEGFRFQVADTLEQYFTDEFFGKLDAHLTETVRAIGSSRDCDIRRWETAKPFTDFPIQSGFTELSQFQDLFTGYFPKRRAFLLDYFRNAEAYCCVSFTGVWYGNVCVPKGSRLWDHIGGANFLDWAMPGYEFTGWRTESGLAPEDVDIVTEDLAFTATFIGPTPE